MSIIFFKKCFNEKANDVFCNKFVATFLATIKMVEHEFKYSISIPDETEYKHGKRVARANLRPNLKGFIEAGLWGNKFGVEADMQIRETYKEGRKYAQEAYVKRKHPQTEWIAEKFILLDPITIEFIATPIAVEITLAFNNQLKYLSNHDCELLASFMAKKMMNYIGSGESSELFSLDDNLRIGLFKNFLLTDLSQEKMPEDSIHLYPYYSRKAHYLGYTVRKLLNELDWGMVNGKVKIYNIHEEYHPKNELSNSFVHC